ncbi:MAG: heavy metal translocating P-type ATPase, partial [Jiangellaceae bacterium]
MTNDQHGGSAVHAVHAEHADHVDHAEHRAHEGHGHGGHADHADHAAQFRSRFWLSLVLTIPVLAFSEMFADLLNFTRPDIPGAGLISPVLGTVVYVYG